MDDASHAHLAVASGGRSNCLSGIAHPVRDVILLVRVLIPIQTIQILPIIQEYPDTGSLMYTLYRVISKVPRIRFDPAIPWLIPVCVYIYD